MIKEIDEKYHSVISDMQKVLKEEYDKTLSDNTLKEIDTINDKEQLNHAITNLNDLLQTIQTEKNIVCTEKEVTEYESKITDLVKAYADRIAIIEKEEQEKEEAERIANQNASNSSSSSNNSSHENSGGSSNSNNSSSNGRYVIKWKS